jgi:hypothetical protein
MWGLGHRFAALLALALAARAETAVLECVSAKNGRAGVLELSFRARLVEGWKIQHATLLVHARGGQAALRTIQLSTTAQPVAVAVRALPEGWYRIDLPEALRADAPATLRLETPRAAGARFDGCSAGEFAPYLIVDGRKNP